MATIRELGDELYVRGAFPFTILDQPHFEDFANKLIEKSQKYGVADNDGLIHVIDKDRANRVIRLASKNTLFKTKPGDKKLAHLKLIGLGPVEFDNASDAFNEYKLKNFGDHEYNLYACVINIDADIFDKIMDNLKDFETQIVFLEKTY